MYKKITPSITLVVACLAVSAVADLVQVRTVGNVDAELTKRVLALLSVEFFTEVKATPLILKDDQSVAAIPGLVAAAGAKSGDVSLVLYAGAAARDVTALFAGGAVLDVPALRDMVKSADAEAQARCVEKESVRLVAVSLGLSDCPNPQCALHKDRSVEQLLNKGRNPCPPCQRILHRILEVRGVSTKRDPPPELKEKLKK